MLTSSIPALVAASSMPQPSDEEKYQNLLIVTFHDPPDDVRSLLRIMYDGTYVDTVIIVSPYPSTHSKFSLILDDPRSTDVAARIAGPLRLAKKYDMEALFRRLRTVLKQAWPARLREWDHRERHIANHKQDTGLSPEGRYNETGYLEYEDPGGSLSVHLMHQVR